MVNGYPFSGRKAQRSAYDPVGARTTRTVTAERKGAIYEVSQASGRVRHVNEVTIGRFWCATILFSILLTACFVLALIGAVLGLRHAGRVDALERAALNPDEAKTLVCPVVTSKAARASGVTAPPDKLQWGKLVVRRVGGETTLTLENIDTTTAAINLHGQVSGTGGTMTAGAVHNLFTRTGASAPATISSITTMPTPVLNALFGNPSLFYVEATSDSQPSGSARADLTTCLPVPV